jgi:hypothetical protein
LREIGDHQHQNVREKTKGDELILACNIPDDVKARRQNQNRCEHCYDAENPDEEGHR